jgi:hypothetical protein
VAGRESSDFGSKNLSVWIVLTFWPDGSGILPLSEAPMPVSEKIGKPIVSLPMHPCLGEKLHDRIAKVALESVQ